MSTSTRETTPMILSMISRWGITRRCIRSYWSRNRSLLAWAWQEEGPEPFLIKRHYMALEKLLIKFKRVIEYPFNANNHQVWISLITKVVRIIHLWGKNKMLVNNFVFKIRVKSKRRHSCQRIFWPFWEKSALIIHNIEKTIEVLAPSKTSEWTSKTKKFITHKEVIKKRV